MCGSVFLTSIICFTFESKYRQQNSARYVDTYAKPSGRRSRYSDPLSSAMGEDIVGSAATRQDDENNTDPDFPRAGQKLSDWVEVFFKANDEDKPDAMAHFIHQAVVRWSSVVRLIEEAKGRGHRAYRTLDLARVRAKAAQLPENGVPAEILRILPHDNALDKIWVQKAATPVEGRCALSGVGDALGARAPNVVVSEKKNPQRPDINAQRLSALMSSTERLTPDSGNIGGSLAAVATSDDNNVASPVIRHVRQRTAGASAPRFLFRSSSLGQHWCGMHYCFHGQSDAQPIRSVGLRGGIRMCFQVLRWDAGSACIHEDASLSMCCRRAIE